MSILNLFPDSPLTLILFAHSRSNCQLSNLDRMSHFKEIIQNTHCSYRTTDRKYQIFIFNDIFFTTSSFVSIPDFDKLAPYIIKEKEISFVHARHCNNGFQAVIKMTSWFFAVFVLVISTFSVHAFPTLIMALLPYVLEE